VSEPGGTRELQVAGRRTRVTVDGNPDAAPILLIHGLGRSLEDWAPQRGLLSAAHRVIAVELPGFGFSDPLDGPITLPALAEAVQDTLGALGEDRPVHVVGHSMGGAVSMQLLVDHPDRVATLVLSNSAGFGRGATALMRTLAVPVLGDGFSRVGARTGLRMFERTIYGDPSHATAARVEHALAINRRPGYRATMLEAIRLMADFRGVREPWRRELLAEVVRHPRPTLALWGDRDRISPVSQLEEIGRVLPHASRRVFAGAGHLPQVEQPERYAATVLEFLAAPPRD